MSRACRPFAKASTTLWRTSKPGTVYDGLIAKGEALQQKQQQSQPLSGEGISDFEQHRDSLLKNPVARRFLDAQQELHEVQEAIHKYVSKTILGQ